jgi:hypothetical protein
MAERECGTIELASAAIVNKETISLWRGGRQKSYSYEKVARAAAHLGTTAEELLDLPAPVEKYDRAAPSAADLPQQHLVERIAKLGPIIESLTELEELVAEARKLSGD